MTDLPLIRDPKYKPISGFGFNLVFRSIAHRSVNRRACFSDQRENLHYWIDNGAREILFEISCAAISRTIYTL